MFSTTKPVIPLSSSAATARPEKNFPSRLYRFLSAVDVHGISHIASWQPDGRCFRIHQPKAFVKLSEPSKYTSFQRQLNIYGFTRITEGVNKNFYFHEHFIRGHEHLLDKIIRVPTKKDVPLVSRALTQRPDHELISDAKASVPDSSANEAYTQLLTNMLHHSNQYRSGNVNDSQVESVLEDEHIEQLRRVNRHNICEAIQLKDAINSNRNLLRNNLLSSAALNRASLLRILENRPSRSMMIADTDLSLVLSQLQRPIAASLQPQRQTSVSEWLQRQLNEATTATSSVTVTPTHRNQIATSPLGSDLRTRLVSYLPQREALNRSVGVTFDPMPLRQLDPTVMNQLSSLVERNTGIQRQALEHYLNSYPDDRRMNTAMSRLSNAPVGLAGTVSSAGGSLIGQDKEMRNYQNNRY